MAIKKNSRKSVPFYVLHIKSLYTDFGESLFLAMAVCGSLTRILKRQVYTDVLQKIY